MSRISEQIEELRLMAEMFVNGEPYGNLLRRAANTIEMLSEKAREPKQGEWIISEVEFGNYKYQCKECGWYEHHAYNDVKPYNFCPNCGCRMKGADDEEI